MRQNWIQTFHMTLKRGAVEHWHSPLFLESIYIGSSLFSENKNWISFLRAVRTLSFALRCFEDYFLSCNKMSSLRDGSDANQRSNSEGSSAGVLQLIAAVSNQADNAQPQKNEEKRRRLRRTLFSNNHLTLERAALENVFTPWIEFHPRVSCGGALCTSHYWDSIVTRPGLISPGNNLTDFPLRSCPGGTAFHLALGKWFNPTICTSDVHEVLKRQVAERCSSGEAGKLMVMMFWCELLSSAVWRRANPMKAATFWSEVESKASRLHCLNVTFFYLSLSLSSPSNSSVVLSYEDQIYLFVFSFQFVAKFGKWKSEVSEL